MYLNFQSLTKALRLGLICPVNLHLSRTYKWNPKRTQMTDDSILLGVRSLVARYLLKKRKQRRIHLLEFLACDSSVGRAVDCKNRLLIFCLALWSLGDGAFFLLLLFGTGLVEQWIVLKRLLIFCLAKRKRKKKWVSQRRLFETPLSHSRSRNENDATNIVPLEHPTLILVSLDAFCFGLRDAFRAFFFWRLFTKACCFF